MVRIIAGKHHGRHLVTPEGRDVRPTSDRVKTALFNILGTWIEGKSVLELYAGAGSIGFECLSRGAAHVTFVENNPVSRSCIIENAMRLHENEQVTLLKTDVNALLAHPGSGTYDFIYADPPYREGDPASLMAGLEHAGIYHDETIVIIEHSNRTAMEKGSIFSGWECYRAAHYGKSVLSFFSRNA